jgi:predicted nucleic acid-binding protein
LSREIRYWDSNCFLAYFHEEKGRVDCCEAVLEDAENGKILIVTSALTLAEVLALRGARRIKPTPAMKSKVIDFFKNEYISVQNVTRQVAEMARDLVWDKGIKPKDAIHVAAALVVEAEIFETFDGPLAKKGRKIGLIIQDPQLPKQPRFPIALPKSPKPKKKSS